MIKSTFTRSLQIQWRVIVALFLREVLTRYGRKNIGFLWLFVEPMLITIAITVLWNINQSGFKLPVTAFIVTGYSSVMLWRNMINRCSGAMTPNIGLLFHKNVKILDVFVARLLLEFAGMTIAFIILILIFIAAGLMAPPDNVLKVILGWMMLAWFGASFGLVLGVLSERSELVEKIWHPMSFLLYPVSGLSFMVGWLPQNLQKFVLTFPMVHGLEILREGYFGDAVYSIYDMSYVSIVCLCLTFIGLLLSKGVTRHMDTA